MGGRRISTKPHMLIVTAALLIPAKKKQFTRLLRRGRTQFRVKPKPDKVYKRNIKELQEKKTMPHLKASLLRIPPDFSTEALKTRRVWKDVQQTLIDQNCQPRLLIQENFQSS